METERRLTELYQAKVNALLDRAEDPRDMLDYSYTRQQELLRQIRRAITDVAAACHRAARHESELRRSAARLQRQARTAVAAGRDDLARQALALRTAILAQASDLSAEQTALRADEARLSAVVRRLQAKVEAFRLHKELLEARYTAAEAVSRAGPLIGGISAEMGDVDQATRRAEDTIARLQARADALADLLACRVPGDVSVLARAEEIQAQLDAVSTRARVEEELAEIRKELARRGPADAPPGR